MPGVVGQCTFEAVIWFDTDMAMCRDGQDARLAGAEERERSRDGEARDQRLQVSDRQQQPFWHLEPGSVDEEGFVRVPVGLVARYYELEQRFCSGLI